LRTYEALYIAKPELKDDEIQTIATEVENMVGAAGGSIVRSEIWGKRRLAYEVDGLTEGAYILLRFQSPATFVAKLENYFRLTETIVRYLTVHFDEKTLRLEEQQKKRVEEQIKASAAAANRDDDDDDDDSGPVYRGRSDRDDDD